MKRKKRIKYFQMCLDVCLIEIDNPTADLVIKLHDLVSMKKGKVTIKDVIKVRRQYDKNIQGADSQTE